MKASKRTLQLFRSAPYQFRSKMQLPDCSSHAGLYALAYTEWYDNAMRLATVQFIDLSEVPKDS